MCLFDPYAMFGVSMPEKLRCWLPFCCIPHSAAAACNACEHAHRACRQYGATGLCHRSCCRRPTGSWSFLCCRCCRFEFSCRHIRSVADMNALLLLTTRATVLMQCSSLLCMLLCRCAGGCRWFAGEEGLSRLPDLRGVQQTAEPLQGQAVCLPSWQVLSGLLQRRASDCSPCNPAAAPEATLRRSAADPAMEAKEAAAVCHSRSITADQLSGRSIAATAAHHSRGAAASDDCRARAYPNCSFAAHCRRGASGAARALLQVKLLDSHVARMYRVLCQHHKGDLSV